MEHLSAQRKTCVPQFRTVPTVPPVRPSSGLLFLFDKRDVASLQLLATHVRGTTLKSPGVSFVACCFHGAFESVFLVQRAQRPCTENSELWWAVCILHVVLDSVPTPSSDHQPSTCLAAWSGYSKSNIPATSKKSTTEFCRLALYQYWIQYGGFLKRGVSPFLIHCNRSFHEKPSSYWGTPMTQEPSYCFARMKMQGNPWRQGEPTVCHDDDCLIHVLRSTNSPHSRTKRCEIDLRTSAQDKTFRIVPQMRCFTLSSIFWCKYGAIWENYAGTFLGWLMRKIKYLDGRD